MDNENLIQELSELLAPADDFALDELLTFSDLFMQYGTPTSLKKGDILFSTQKPKPTSVSLITKGAVKSSQVTLAGNENIYNFARTGDILFLIAAIRDEPPQIDFVASENTELLCIENDRFMALLESDIRLATIVIDYLANKLSSAYRRHREAETYSTEWKVCNMLLKMASRSGVEYDGKILIREKVSQQEMAGMLKVSRITIARILKDLRNYGLIETVNSFICIRNEEKLRQHMYYVSLPLE